MYNIASSICHRCSLQQFIRDIDTNRLIVAENIRRYLSSIVSTMATSSRIMIHLTPVVRNYLYIVELQVMHYARVRSI